MALRQPSLTIPLTSHHEKCAKAWQEISQSCLNNLEQVDVNRATEVKDLQTFSTRFSQWQQLATVRNHHALGGLTTIPHSLESFDKYITLIYYSSASAACLWGMVLVSLEAAVESAQYAPLLDDSNDLLLRLGEMLVGIGQKLQLVSALGMAEPHTQQDMTLIVYRSLLQFLECVVICLREAPIENFSTQRWRTVEEQHQIAEHKLDKAYKHIRELQVLKNYPAEYPRLSFQPSISPSNMTPSVDVQVVPHTMMLPSRNLRFYGRKVILESMISELGDPTSAGKLRSLMVWGLGGVGKTELVREFAYEAEKYHDVTLWLLSQSTLSLDQAFTAAALRLRLAGATGHDDRQNRALVLNFLSQTSQSWLLIFNNLEDSRLIHEYLPSVGNGSIIITARNPNISFNFTTTSIKLEPFSDKEGTECLIALSTADSLIKADESAAAKLNHQLGGLPLAISQMAAFMRSRKLTMQTCTEIYSKNKKRVHRLAGKSARYSDYEQDLSTVWELQFRNLGSSEGRIMLGVLIFVSPDSVPEKLFVIAPVKASNPFPQDLAFCHDVLSSTGAEEELLDLALIQKTSDTGDISLHRLVQVEFQFFIPHDERQRAFYYTSILLNEAFPKRVPGQKMHGVWDECEKFVEHILSLNAAYVTKCEDLPRLKASKEFCELVDNCGWYLYEVAKFRELEILIAGGFEACEEFPDDPSARLRYASLCNTQAQSYNVRGYFKDAMAGFTKSLDIKSKYLDETDKSLKGTYGNLSLLYETLGDIDESLKYRKIAIDLLLQMPPSAEREVSITMKDAALARCLIRQGKFQEAESCLDNMIKVFEKNWFLMAHTHFTYGRLYYSMRDMKRSRSSYEEAKRFMIEVGNSPLHPFTVACLYKLGCIAFDQGDFNQALSLFQEALDVLELDPLLEAHRARLLYMMSQALQKCRPPHDENRIAQLQDEAIKIAKKLRPEIHMGKSLTREIFDILVPGQSQ